MPRFHYKAKRGLSEIVSGQLEAQDQTEALMKIEQLGLFPVQVAAAADIPLAAARSRKPLKKTRRRVDPSDVLNLVKKLLTLTRARVELLASLRILHEQTENALFQEMILDIYNTTKEGKPFSQALSGFPAVFSPLFISIIRAGEASGRLEESLSYICDFMTREESLKNRVRVALAYPALLLGVGITSIFILLNFVVPKLRPLLEGMGKDLPLVTRAVLGVSDALNRSWLIAAGVLIVAAAFFYKKKGKDFLRRALRGLGEMLPVIRRLNRNQELVYFTQSLGLLLKSGIPALKAFEIAIPTLNDGRMKEEFARACLSIADGQSVSRALAEKTGLPEFFVQMIAVGEQSGRLVEVLEEIALSYRQQIENDIALVVSLVEPMLILGMGVVLGGIVLSILLPTFQITQTIR
jgi:type II secretory pathway component PulF